MRTDETRNNGNQELGDRFYKFALKIIKLVGTLPKTIAGYELGKQLVRAAMSISSNYEEARGAYTKPDFAFKLSICFKEARESYNWLSMIKDSGLLAGKDVDEAIKEAGEIRNILGKGEGTARKHLP